MCIKQCPSFVPAAPICPSAAGLEYRSGQIVDLTPTDTMTGIAWGQDGAARTGAMVTIETLASDARVRSAYLGLAGAAASLATPQIRTVGTLGGNLHSTIAMLVLPAIRILLCLKKGGPVCPARAGNHLYGVAFDLGPCVAPHPSTLAAALLAYDGTVTTNERSGSTISDELLGDGSDGTVDNKLKPGEYIIHVDIRSPLEREHAGYHRGHQPHLCRMAVSRGGRSRGFCGQALLKFVRALQQVVLRRFRCASSTPRRHCGPRLLK